MSRSLLPGESLVSKTHRHWVLLAKSLWLPVLLLTAVVFADVLLSDGVVPGEGRAGLGLAAVAQVLWAIAAWLRWAGASLTLTDQRVILEAGVLSRATRVIALDRVQDVSTRQGLLGRLLGYGTVEIDSAGAAGAEVLDHLPQPGALRDAIYVQADVLRRARGRPRESAPSS